MSTASTTAKSSSASSSEAAANLQHVLLANAGPLVSTFSVGGMTGL